MNMLRTGKSRFLACPEEECCMGENLRVPSVSGLPPEARNEYVTAGWHMHAGDDE